jgi:hypothetical protein
MEHVTYMPKEAKRDKERLTILKFVLFVFNFLVFSMACLLLGVAIWMGVDRNFMTFIIGNNLYAAAVFIVLACGGVIFFISFVGCCGVVLEKSRWLAIYFVFLVVIFLFLIIAGILAAIFHNQIGDKVKSTMSDTLINSYGVNFESKSNRDITDAWDKAQERLMCCAVENNGWYLYRQSQWYQQFGSQVDRPLTYQDQEQRPYVPQSCCVKDKLWRYVNLDVCQTWRLGPPGSPVDGAINRALFYTGCFDAGVVYLKAHASVLIGLAFAIAIMLIVGIVLSALIIIRLRKQTTDKATR